ncbi:hypothetical protein RHSIM_Rhsim05G0101200 [Rhododendron simsii]|uniref:FAR1 domain-containing protein n=1 Tax=Rhododendron simsii TaxID=118357 RepID=A0A834LL87_RHOSS|nr:hypothetical protein RHSIM_Rhsim05G0101200 [Rhododendron simsii]
MQIHSSKTDKNKEIIRKEYVCYKEGVRKISAANIRRQGLTREGCGAKLSVMNNRSGEGLAVSQFVEGHNHLLTTPKKSLCSCTFKVDLFTMVTNSELNSKVDALSKELQATQEGVATLKSAVEEINTSLSKLTSFVMGKNPEGFAQEFDRGRSDCKKILE